MKYMKLTDEQKERHPSIHYTGSVRGMKKLGYWGKHDVCVRCGQYIYNISIWLDPNRSNKTERPKEELPQAYLDILEKREWSVCDYTDDGRVELEWYSPAGEDFIVCVKVENFPDEILDYSDSFDPVGKKPGRGAYLCPDAACLAKAKKKKCASAHEERCPSGLRKQS